MKFIRPAALITALVITVSCTGCEYEDIKNKLTGESTSEASSSQTETPTAADDGSSALSTETVTLDEVKEHTEKTIEDIKDPNNLANVTKDLETLLHDIDTANEMLSVDTINYYLDWNNEELEEKYDSSYETYYVAYELALYAFSKGCQTNYASLFEPYADEEYHEYFQSKGLTIKRLMGYAKVDYDVMYEYTDRYYDILSDRKMNETVKNNEAADIYLELLSGYDPDDFYDMYYRDFTPEEIIALSAVVKEKLIPVMQSIEEKLDTMPEYKDILEDPQKFDNLYDTVNTCAPKLSDSIADAASSLCSEKLYTISSGSDSYDGSFTSSLPLESKAMIYIHKNDNYYDLPTAVHEFGHFYAAGFDDTRSVCVKNNIDIAEIQSQGMEVMFLPLYDEIYGENADVMQLLSIYQLLDSVVSGFTIGEFEYYILSNADTLTPDDVLSTYSSYMEEYDPDMPFYYIHHLFEYPGYYISYGVSALAAFDIWNTAQTDSAKALQMYENIARVKSNSGEYQFKSALESCGFDNVLSVDFISALADSVTAFSASFGS